MCLCLPLARPLLLLPLPLLLDAAARPPPLLLPLLFDILIAMHFAEGVSSSFPPTV